MISRECGKFVSSYREDMAIHRLPLARLGVMLALFLVFVAFPLIAMIFSEYLITIGILVGIAVVGAVGLNLLLGYAGQISIAHGAFMGIGAYTTALVTNNTPIPFFLALILGGVGAMLVGLIFGLPSVRIKGLYLAIATLAAQYIIDWFIIRAPAGITGGTGATLVKRPVIAGFSFDSDMSYYFIVAACVVLALVFAENLLRTRIGRGFIAVREREVAARILGVNVSGYKLMAFMISSFYAGIAGGLWGAYTLAISYEHFTILTSIQYLAMIIVGGLGSLVGSVYGAVLITLLPLLLRSILDVIAPSLPGVVSSFAYFREFLFGLIIVLFLIFEPRGLAQIWVRTKNYIRLWPFGH